MLSITDLKVRSLDVDRKEVSWATGGTQEDALDYRFEVLRSESPEGPFEAVSPAFEDRYLFVDARVPTGDRFRQLWYKVRVTRKRDSKAVDYGPATQEAEPDLIAQYIRRCEMTAFTQVIGRAVWLFKKRTFGAACRNCWDPVMHKRIAERCADCFGTGMLRGYHNPIEVWMQIDPSTKAQQNNAQQITQGVTTTARMSFYPNVSIGDVIVEAENRRWEVTKISTTERLRAPVKQELLLHEIDHSDMRFRLPINLDVALRDIQPSPSRMFENPTDLNSAIRNRTPNVFAAFGNYPKILEE